MSNKKLNATITIGGAVSGTLGSALRYAANEINAVTNAIKNQTREQFKLGAATKQYEQQSKEAMKAARSRELAASGKSHLGSAGIAFGVVGASAAAAAFPVKAAVDFEDAMLGVAKQVKGARDESGKLTPVYFEMAKEIQALGRIVPVATNELAAMAAAGARMDIPREQLIAFTRTAAMMAEAFELPAAELADQMGKIQKLFGLKTQNEVRALADSVNYLDDNAISKGGDIIEFLTRTGGLAGSVKITGAEMAAIGSTLLTLGETSETAGSSVNSFFNKLASAETLPKKARAAMETLGLSLRDVQKGMQVDAKGTMLTVLDKLRAMPKDQQIGLLTKIIGLEHAPKIAKLANGIQELRSQIDLSNSSAAQGSMAKEFAARLETTGAKAKLLKNEMVELAVSIGSNLLPVIKEVLPKIGEAVKDSVEWISANKDTIMEIGKVAAAVLIGAQAFGTISSALGIAKLAMAGFNKVSKANWVIFGISTLVTGAMLVYEHWDKVRAVFVSIGEAVENAWDKTKEFLVGFGGQAAAKRYRDDRDAAKALAKEEERARDQRLRDNFDGSQNSSPVGLPPLPSIAGARDNSSSVVTTTNTFHLTQQPGQDNKDFAREVVEQMNRKQSVGKRGSLVDPVGAF